MRLSTDPDRDAERARATIEAALAAGVTVFDTAHAYGLDAGDYGHNERLVAGVLRAAGKAASARVITCDAIARFESFA